LQTGIIGWRPVKQFKQGLVPVNGRR